jgi:hypothetical protein
MKKDLQNQLLEKYPKIFKQKNNRNSPMFFGISCGDGWFKLIDVLCCLIQNDIDASKGKIPQIEAVQIKEKFGGLRFYYSPHNRYYDGLIDFAQTFSYYICEECGSTDNVGLTNTTFVQSLCKNCKKNTNV